MFTPIVNDNARPVQNSDAKQSAFPAPALNNPLNAQDVASQLAVILEPQAVYEVRALGVFDSDDERTDIYSALFRGHEVDEMAREVLRLSGKCKGIYATINPLKDVRFGYLPGAHRLKPSLRTTKDGGIPERRENVLDFDAPRAVGHEHDPATDEERAIAWANLTRARGLLANVGITSPTVQDSGNGYYLRFPLEPFAVIEGDDIIHRVAEYLGADTSVCNPSRIMRLPGGLNCKGKESEGRPWRVSRIMEIGSGVPVRREQLESIAVPVTVKKQKQVADAKAQKELNEWLGVAPTSGGCTPLTPELEERASRYIDTIDSGIQGQGNAKSSKSTLWAARVLIHGFRFSPSDTYALLERHYNPRCVPAWSPKELQHKVDEAATKPFRKEEGWALKSKPKAKRNPDYTADEIAEIAASLKQDLLEKAKQVPPDAPLRPPEPCPYAAFKDGREWMRTSFARCQKQSPVILKKGYMPFVSDRPCGNGRCRPCLMNRVYKSLRESDSYLMQYHIKAEHEGTGEPRAVYAAIVPSSFEPNATRWDTFTNNVGDMEGERFSILTEDMQGVAAQLANGDKVSSGFFLKDNKVEEESRNGARGRLVFISLPADQATEDVLVIAGLTFRRVSVGCAINAMYCAAKSVPKFTADDKNCKVTHHSTGWGNKEDEPPSEVTVVWPSKLTVKDTRRFCAAVNVETHDVAFGGRTASQPGVGWLLPPVQSLAVCMLLGGVGAPDDFTVTLGAITDLAKQHVLPILADAPNDIGDGPCVIAAMTGIIWNREVCDVTERLSRADAFDKLTSEAESIREAIKKQYKDREHEASEFIREFVLCA